MAETHDTIDGLLAEFRGYSAGMPPSYHVTMSWADFRKMLNRFEAAHKRERGDAAMLREALEALMIDFDSNYADDDDIASWCDVNVETVRKARAALSAPPRNCDVGTVEEQADRMDAVYCSKRLCAKGKCPLFKPGGDCSLIWAQMPYEEGGAK